MSTSEYYGKLLEILAYDYVIFPDYHCSIEIIHRPDMSSILHYSPCSQNWNKGTI